MGVEPEVPAEAPAEEPAAEEEAPAEEEEVAPAEEEPVVEPEVPAEAPAEEPAAEEEVVAEEPAEEPAEPVEEAPVIEETTEEEEPAETPIIMDACGDNCECPEGMTGIEPFCEEETVLAPIAPGDAGEAPEEVEEDIIVPVDATFTGNEAPEPEAQPRNPRRNQKLEILEHQ